MEKLNKLESVIVEKEIAEINSEFARASKIINDVMERYGKKFSIKERTFKGGPGQIFTEAYFGGYYMSKARLVVVNLPESFLKKVEEKAISDFMDNIEHITDITSSL